MMPARLSRLDRTIHSMDFDAALDAVLSLKTSSMMVGAFLLGVAAAELEAKLKLHAPGCASWSSVFRTDLEHIRDCSLNTITELGVTGDSDPLTPGVVHGQRRAFKRIYQFLQGGLDVCRSEQQQQDQAAVLILVIDRKFDHALKSRPLSPPPAPGEKRGLSTFVHFDDPSIHPYPPSVHFAERSAMPLHPFIYKEAPSLNLDLSTLSTLLGKGGLA